MNSKKIFVALLICLLVITVWAIYRSLSNQPLVLQGEVEVNRVDVSARVQGRASQINVDVGSNVEKNDILLLLDSPALMAQKEVIKSQLDVAIANRDTVYSTRPETISAQKAALEKAQADLILAKQSYDRIAKLSSQNLVSKQQYDEAKNQLEAANKAYDAAKANYDLVVNGSSVEAKALADAQVKQAQAALDQIEVDIKELTVKAPISGQITAKIAEVGQLYNPGTPLFSLVNLDDIWFTFNVREDLLNGAKINDVYYVTVPALNKKIQVKITAINALGQYANWRATKATGDFDLKTFEVRAKPIEPVDGLRAGMSAIVKWQKQ